MRSRCALLLLGLSACSGEDAAPSPPAPAQAAQSAPARAAQPPPAPPAVPTPPAPVVTISELDPRPASGGALFGALTSADSESDPVLRVILSRVRDLKSCYTRPGAPKRVHLVLGLSVGRSGHLTALEVKSTDRAVAECIAPLAAGWTFDPRLDAAGKPTAATYEVPVHFATQ